MLGSLGLHLPVLSLGPLAAALASPDVWNWLAIIVPMGLINVLGAIQCLESAEAVFLIEREFHRAALWALGASAFSAAGLMHSYSLAPTAVREEMRPGFAWQAAAGYLGLALVFALVGWWNRGRSGASPHADGLEM